MFLILTVLKRDYSTPPPPRLFESLLSTVSIRGNTPTLGIRMLFSCLYLGDLASRLRVWGFRAAGPSSV